MSNSKTLLGFVAGAAVGALAGILFAPDKGSETRRKIKSRSGELADSVKHKFNDFIDGVKHIYSSAEDGAEEFTDKAKAKVTTAKNEVKNTLS
jgi:gas vesicle protein